MPTYLIKANPHKFKLNTKNSALLMIDMQRDFLDKGGFADQMGYDVSKAQKCIGSCQNMLKSARNAGINVIFTREGFNRNFSNLAKVKHSRKFNKRGIGSHGPLGKALIRGEKGHEIIDGLSPLQSETIINKSGHGAFYATELEVILKAKQITTLLICGVITEVCIQSTVREGKDHGYSCLVLEDCVGSYNDEFHRVSLEMINAQNGIFGYLSKSKHVINSLNSMKSNF